MCPKGPDCRLIFSGVGVLIHRNGHAPPGEKQMRLSEALLMSFISEADLKGLEKELSRGSMKTTVEKRSFGVKAKQRQCIG